MARTARALRFTSEGLWNDMLSMKEPYTRDEALKLMTIWPAQAAFMEAEVGSLSVGKRADFVVLATDPFRLRGRGLLALKIRSTWVDGEQVWPKR